ncbi:MAG TPA: hypothetical protein VEA61_03190 [Allosphingosinicella sp.]|nr:hypothetical protein [Allosphingosinicella sp.]
MPYTQKEEGLGQYNSSVQIHDDQEFGLVPEFPLLLQVDMPFLQFHTPNVRIDRPKDDVVYLVALESQQLTIEEVPIGTDAGEARRTGRSRDESGKGSGPRR